MTAAANSNRFGVRVAVLPRQSRYIGASRSFYYEVKNRLEVSLARENASNPMFNGIDGVLPGGRAPLKWTAQYIAHSEQASGPPGAPATGREGPPSSVWSGIHR